MGGKCSVCGTDDLEVLEFDHISDDKISEVRKIYNYEGMLNEAKKCDLKCVRCHIIKTKDTVTKPQIDESINNPSAKCERKNRENSRNFVNQIKLNSSGCVECGWFDENYLEVLHFDHIDENDKEHNISRLVSTGRSLELIQSEIERCQVLCGNCHRKRTLRQFNYPVLQLIANIKTDN